LGRRRRVQLVSSHVEELRPDVVVWDGDTFWSRTDGRMLTNHGDPAHGHGGDEFTALLDTAYVPVLFDLTVLGTATVTGVDDVTGVLLRVVKLVDGAEAEIVEWTELALDMPLDDALFDPLE
jgi:hypothetical protein